MQKTIKTLAIIAVILVAFAMLALLISIPLQRVLATKVFHYPADMAYYLPIFPVEPFLRCLLLLGCTILLAVCAGKKGIILPEILILCVMILVIPALSSFLSTTLIGLAGRLKGDIYVAAQSLTAQISSYFLVTANLGNALGLVACGMNMVHKRMSKKLDKLSTQA